MTGERVSNNKDNRPMIPKDVFNIITNNLLVVADGTNDTAVLNNVRIALLTLIENGKKS